MKRAQQIIALVAMVFSFTFGQSSIAQVPADVATTLPAKKTSAAASKSTVPQKKKKKKTELAALPPKTLPAFKARRKVQVDFDAPAEAGTHETTVVVRAPLPLAVAEKENDSTVTTHRQQTRISVTRAEPEVFVPPIAVTTAPPSARPIESLPSAWPESLSLPADMMNEAPEQRFVPARPVETTHLARTAPVEAMTPAPQPSRPVTTVMQNPEPSPTPNAVVIVNENVTSAASETTSKAPVPTSVATMPRQESNALVSGDVENRTWLLVGAGYLQAPYSQLEGDLQDGANDFRLSLEREISEPMAFRLTAQIGFGLDQSVVPQDTRYALLRADAIYRFLPTSTISPFIAAGLGYGQFHVFSVRSASGNQLTIREHADTAGFTLTPGAGVRLNLDAQWAIEIGLEYQSVFGASNASSALGGLGAAATLGFAL